MNRPASLALLVVGIILLGFGWDAYQSMSSGFSRLFTGAPTDRAMWLIVGGGLAVASGLAGLARPMK